MDTRVQQLANWVSQELRASQRYSHASPVELSMVSGDASFRRYFRASLPDGSYIAVDAPPEKEESASFVAIARSWLNAGILVPEVIAADLSQGFMLLSDFGDLLYLDHLDSDTAEHLYQQAINTLVQIQSCPSVEGYSLPAYSREPLLSEMALCTEWFFPQLLKLELATEERELFEEVADKLVVSALAQPQVCVHRDYHSRNLMLLDDGALGVLDFQDAVIGPLSYDLVSLLRDCYICWSAERERHWIESYMQRSGEAGILADMDYDDFKRAFDWMGLQRHIKVVGIFSRLYLRDGKAGYLQDIPRTFRYLRMVCAAYPEFAEFNRWLELKVIPAMEKHELLPPLSSVVVFA